MYFFTADEHYGHRNVIDYNNRPYENTDEMDHDMIAKHNEVVSDNDVVVHGGDFTLKGIGYAKHIIKQLNGKHVFLIGSHDYWLKGRGQHIWEKTINKQRIVVCHYAMRVWPRSHYGSWQIYGHSHGHLPPQGKQWDVGVDNNSFYPVSFDELSKIMSGLPENFNLVKK